MKLTTTKRFDAIIPTASMADIAFLLIIFFMVTTVHDVDRTSVNLPVSQTREETQKGAPYVIVYKDENGAVAYKFSNGTDKSDHVGGPGDIYLEASRIAYTDSSRQFVIKADADIRYFLIDEVLDQLRKAGVQHLLLLTHQRTAEGAP